MSTVQANLRDVVRASPLIDDGDRVLVAVSGGPDSMALLDALRRVPRKVELVAAHFDHRLRDDGDREVVTAYCREHNVECRTGAADVRGWSRARRLSLEAGARHLRYRFLDETADAVDADKIATAHTRDDNVETVLMRVLRGSGIRGLAGIPRRRGRIVRPFLEVKRDWTLGYCRANGVPFVEDPSNRDTRFERNYVRHELLPRLRAVDRDTEAGLETLRRTAADTVASVRRATDAVLAEHFTRERDGVWTLSTAPVAALDPLSRYVLFADALSYHMRSEAEPGRVHFDALSALLDRAPGAGNRTSLPGIDVRREHDALVFRARREDRADEPFGPRVLALPGVTHVDGLRVTVGVVSSLESRPFERPAARAEQGCEKAYFAIDAIEPPLVVRAPRAGDRMQPFGMSGTKKLSDIFIDRKIPYRRRGGMLVVEDRREIVWVVGVTTSESTRITEETREALVISVNDETEEATTR